MDQLDLTPQEAAANNRTFVGEIRDLRASGTLSADTLSEVVRAHEHQLPEVTLDLAERRVRALRAMEIPAVVAMWQRAVGSTSEPIDIL